MNLHTEEIQKLKEERAETEAKIEQLRHQNERLKNREQYLTKRDRAARTHRLCVTGGIVESILPDIKTLTEAEHANSSQTARPFRRNGALIPMQTA